MAIGFIILVLLVAMLITLLTVREEPMKEAPAEPLKAALLGSFKVHVRRYPDFVCWLLNRLLLLAGLTAIQAFALYFIEDVLKFPNPAKVTGHLAAIVGLSILIAILPAGYLGDRLGHKPLLVISGLGGDGGPPPLVFGPKLYKGPGLQHPDRFLLWPLRQRQLGFGHQAGAAKRGGALPGSDQPGHGWR